MSVENGEPVVASLDGDLRALDEQKGGYGAKPRNVLTWKDFGVGADAKDWRQWVWLGMVILVSPDRPKGITDSGLHLAAELEEDPIEGRVLAVGDGVRKVQAGDRIRYRRYSGAKEGFWGEDLVIVEEANVLGYWRAG